MNPPNPHQGMSRAFYVVGQARVSSRKSTVTYWIVRKSSNGGASWTTVDTVAGGRACGFTADSNGNLFVAGSSSTSAWTVRESVHSNGNSDYATIKYSNAGVPLWTRLYNGPGSTYSGTNAFLQCHRSG